MSQLEGQLGFTLCQRGRGGFSLTEKGQQFLQQAIRVLSELNELERQSALLKGEHSGTLCISTLDSIETETALSLPVVLRSFSDKFPHVHIKLIIRTPAEQLNGVLNNHIDWLSAATTRRCITSSASRCTVNSTGSTAAICTRCSSAASSIKSRSASARW